MRCSNNWYKKVIQNGRHLGFVYFDYCKIQEMASYCTQGDGTTNICRINYETTHIKTYILGNRIWLTNTNFGGRGQLWATLHPTILERIIQ